MALSNSLRKLLMMDSINIQVVEAEEVKAVMSAIKEYRTDIQPLLDRVKSNGFVFIAEPLLIYNPTTKEIGLGITKPEGCQVLKKLYFNPKFQQLLLSYAKVEGYTSTALVETYSGHNITTIIIGRDQDTTRDLRKVIEKIYKERGMIKNEKENN